jgi:hypothetical protein
MVWSLGYKKPSNKQKAEGVINNIYRSPITTKRPHAKGGYIDNDNR